MDFEKIDTVYGDSLGKGDIISEDGEFIQLNDIVDNDLEAIEAYGYNLSTGDDWDNLLDPAASYNIFRSY